MTTSTGGDAELVGTSAGRGSIPTPGQPRGPEPCISQTRGDANQVRLWSGPARRPEPTAQAPQRGGSSLTDVAGNAALQLDASGLRRLIGTTRERGFEGARDRRRGGAPDCPPERPSWSARRQHAQLDVRCALAQSDAETAGLKWFMPPPAVRTSNGQGPLAGADDYSQAVQSFIAEQGLRLARGRCYIPQTPLSDRLWPATRVLTAAQLPSLLLMAFSVRPRAGRRGAPACAWPWPWCTTWPSGRSRRWPLC